MANVKEFLGAAHDGDLPRVQKMLADGDALITDADRNGHTALLRAANGGYRSFSTLKWLLKERCSHHRKGQARLQLPSIDR
jgi:hypothetical protein